MYDGRENYPLRKRQPWKDNQGGLSFTAKNDMERLYYAAKASLANEQGPWDESQIFPTWRTTEPEKWIGKPFNSTVNPWDNWSHRMTGDSYEEPMSIKYPQIIK